MMPGTAPCSTRYNSSVMTSSHDDFLQTILASPDDDAPRLVFADWLEEAGDCDRAEFIRLQCEMARLTKDDPRAKRMVSRERELLAQHYMEWQTDLPQLEEVTWGGFHRGFVGAIRIESAEAFADQAATIFAAAPIREVRFHRVFGEGAKRIALTPQLARIHVLDLEDGNLIGNAGAQALANSPYLSGLTSLKLRGNAIGPAGARALARAAHLGPVVELNLDHNAIYDEGVQALAESPRLRHLRQLSLGWTQCGETSARSMARSSYLSHLHWLYLSGNQIGDDGVEALSESRHLAGLTELFLEGNRIGDRGIRALARSPVLSGGIVWLYLKGNRIGDDGARDLAESQFLQHVKELVLLENPIGDDATERLRQRFGSRVWLW
jgi:uncharacterized protein (TIGR02996 family)